MTDPLAEGSSPIPPPGARPRSIPKESTGRHPCSPNGLQQPDQRGSRDCRAATPPRSRGGNNQQHDRWRLRRRRGVRCARCARWPTTRSSKAVVDQQRLRAGDHTSSCAGAASAARRARPAGIAACRRSSGTSNLGPMGRRLHRHRAGTGRRRRGSRSVQAGSAFADSGAVDEHQGAVHARLPCHGRSWPRRCEAYVPKNFSARLHTAVSIDGSGAGKASGRKLRPGRRMRAAASRR